MDAHTDKIAQSPMEGASRAGRRILRWVVGVTVTLGLLATVATMQPSVGQLLAAAARARASLRYDRALEWYARAATADPDDPRPLCGSAETLALEQEWEASSADYARCLRISPTGGAAWLSYGDVLARQGNAEAAQNAWARATVAGEMQGLRQSALSHESVGQLARAQSTWARLPATNAEARAHLGLLAISSGDDASAAA